MYSRTGGFAGARSGREAGPARTAAVVACAAAAVLAALAAGPRFLHAQSAEEALITDRPDFTESPVSVAPGRVQLEGGYTFSRVEDERAHSVGELLVRIGAVDRLEFRVGINSIVFASEPADSNATAEPGILRSVRGLEDVSLGLKLEVLRPPPATRAVPQVAILAGTTLPTGRSGVGSDGLQPGALLAAGWGLTDRLSAGMNVGYAYAAGEDAAGEETRLDELSASVAFGVGLTERLGAFAEWFGIYPLPADLEAENNLDTGVTYLLSPNFQLDARIGVGLGGPRPNFFVGAGAAWRI